MSELLAALAGVEGWFTETEALMLLDAAQETLSRLDGAVVEVGSYHGRSTIALAIACREHGEIVNAIDPHEGDLGPGAPITDPSWEAFQSNLKRAGVSDYVRPIRARAEDVPWFADIALLFIDGQHDEPSVRRDFEHFRPMLLPGVTVLFHDYGKPELEWGVTTVVDELLSGGWREVARADSLIAVVSSA